MRAGENDSGRVISIVITLCAAAALVATITHLISPLIALGTTLVLAVLNAAKSYRYGNADVFHPAVFPSLYVNFALVLPLIYSATTGRDFFRYNYYSINPDTLYLMSIFSLGVVVTTAFVAVSPRMIADVELERSTLRRIETFGNVFLVTACAGKLAQVLLGRGLQYGQAQTEYGIRSAITVASEGVLTIAILLIVFARARAGKPPVNFAQALVLLAVVATSFFLLGSRSELIAPTLILLWGIAARTGLSTIRVILIALFGVALSNWVGDTRAGETTTFSLSAILERSFLDTTTPIVITNQLVLLREQGLSFYFGETYLSSLQMLAPGVVSRALTDGDPNTATFVYRQLIGFDNPDNGVGFALPAEAFMNFGTVGVLASAAILGGLLSFLYGKQFGTNSPTLSIAYIVVASSIPYAIRSDSLALLKLTVYPLAAFWIVLTIARTSRHSDNPRRGKQEAEA